MQCNECKTDCDPSLSFCTNCGTRLPAPPSFTPTQNSASDPPTPGGSPTTNPSPTSIDTAAVSAGVSAAIAQAKVNRASRMTSRPAPTIWQAIYASLGAIAPICILVLLGESSESPVLGAIIGLAVTVGAVLVARKFPDKFTAGVLAACVISVPLFWVFITQQDGYWSSGRTSFALVMTAVSLLALYLFEPRVSGHTPLLGASIAWFIISLIYLNASANLKNYYYDVIDPDLVQDLFEESLNRTLTLLLVLGIAGLIATFILDDRGFHGAATATLVNSIALSLFGFGALADDLGDGKGAAFGLLLIGIILAVVGHNGSRRFSLWFGAVTIAIGVFGVSVQDSASGTATVALLIAVGLAAAAFAISKNLDDGKMPAWFPIKSK